MNLKRILILTLTLLFLVSTTGLPVTIHLCKMADSGDTSECMMHHKPVKSGCCSMEISTTELSVSSQIPPCCETEFVYNKVKDDFVTNKTDVNFFTSTQILFQSVSIIPTAIDLSMNESYYCDSSPPFLINSDLNITNSILLI